MVVIATGLGEAGLNARINEASGDTIANVTLGHATEIAAIRSVAVLADGWIVVLAAGIAAVHDIGVSCGGIVTVFNLDASAQGDTLTGSDGKNRFVGANAKDPLRGGGGDDIFLGGKDDDAGSGMIPTASSGQMPAETRCAATLEPTRWPGERTRTHSCSRTCRTV